jgi:hypothetical protein
MIKILFSCFSSLVLLSTFLSNKPSTAPTFAKDVAPILYKNCAVCHRPGDIGPMSLLTYDDARPWAKAIREQVASGQMPPWHATQSRDVFLNDRRLSDQDKETLVRWVNEGAQKGEAKDLPPAPKFPDGWEIGTPDAVISMPTDYTVPAEGTIDYQYVEAKTNFTEDKWVQAIEVRPGARSVVHHVLLFCREPGSSAEPKPFEQIVPAPRRSNRHQGGSEHRRENDRGVLIATTAPGTNAVTFQPGSALRIKAGSILTFQLHYTANGKETKDRSSAGLIFAKESPKHEVRTDAFLDPTFVLPAGSKDTAVQTAIQFKEDSTIWGIFPHTHLRGKSWEYRLVHPDGRTEVVLSVPKYDFNWQTYYLFSKPLSVTKGSKLEATAHYDNSASNPFNPDPKIDVRWGEQTWEEMQYSGITYTVNTQRQPAAERKAGQQ